MLYFDHNNPTSFPLQYTYNNSFRELHYMQSVYLILGKNGSSRKFNSNSSESIEFHIYEFNFVLVYLFGEIGNGNVVYAIKSQNWKICNSIGTEQFLYAIMYVVL